MSNNHPIIKIKVQLLRPEEGGRQTLLQIGHYRPHIRFDTSAKLWAVGLNISEKPSYDNLTIMEGDFLFEIPPNALMKIGTKVDIIEGTSKVVGHGTITDLLEQ